MKRILLVTTLLCLMASSALARDCSVDPHVFGSWITHREATCTMVGDQIRYCRNCDHWENRDIKKLPHTPDEWVVTREATCTEDGKMDATCTVCHGHITKKIEKLGHDWQITNAKIAPTCKAAGEGEQTCARCGKVRNGKLNKLTHEYTDWVVTKEPNGKTKGSREHTCLLCGEVKTEKFYLEGTLYEDMPSCYEVVIMQTMLKDLGYYTGSIGNGNFRRQTATAVARFQKAAGLKASEVADPQTLIALTAAWEAKTGRSASELAKPEKMQ